MYVFHSCTVIKLLIVGLLCGWAGAAGPLLSHLNCEMLFSYLCYPLLTRHIGKIVRWPSFILSVHLSARNSAAPTVQIFMKFDDFLKILSGTGTLKMNSICMFKLFLRI